MDISTSELIAELHKAARAADAPDGSITSTEIKEATGWGLAKTLTVLRKLIKQGSVRPVRTRRVRIDGLYTEVTAYVFTKTKAKAGR